MDGRLFRIVKRSLIGQIINITLNNDLEDRHFHI
jgi:hypothetical protein